MLKTGNKEAERVQFCQFHNFLHIALLESPAQDTGLMQRSKMELADYGWFYLHSLLCLHKTTYLKFVVPI
jgi:hypothetical protein